MQFRLDNGCVLSLVLIVIFLFCGVVYAVGPILWGFFAAFAFAGKLVESCCFGLCKFRYRSNCCCKAFLVLLNALLYLIVWAIAEAFTLSLGIIIGSLAVTIMTIPTMFSVIYFSIRLLCLRCKRLR